jgi:hypothetical protein
MYINGKYDGIILVFLTGINLPSIEKIKKEKPVAILHPVPPAPPPIFQKTTTISIKTNVILLVRRFLVCPSLTQNI